MNAVTQISAPESDAGQSAQLDKLFEALAVAQAVDMTAAFNRTNPHFKNKYADLSSVWDCVRKSLPKHGLAVVQFPMANGADVSVRTVIGHSSGHWIASTITAKAGGTDPQKIGSAITYLRRYGLCAMVGVVADDDDDGQQAMAPPRRSPMARWLIVSRDGAAETFGTRAEWASKWKIKIKAVTEAEKIDAEKVATLKAMAAANSAAMNDLREANEGAAVEEVSKLLRAAIAQLTPAQENTK
jgi:hypothetical protein